MDIKTLFRFNSLEQEQQDALLGILHTGNDLNISKAEWDDEDDEGYDLAQIYIDIIYDKDDNIADRRLSLVKKAFGNYYIDLTEDSKLRVNTWVSIRGIEWFKKCCIETLPDYIHSTYKIAYSCDKEKLIADYYAAVKEKINNNK